MKPPRLSAEAGKLFQNEFLKPALTRALRGTVAFVGPLILAQQLGFVNEVAFAATGAQVVALTDVRGAYRLRLVVLLVVAAVITAATLLGTVAYGHLGLSVAAIGVLALLAGVWRHLSGDYGPGLGIASALLFIMALALPSGSHPLWHHAAFTLAGATWGIVLQALLWPFRPQHPVRQAVAESWLAVSELFAAMRPEATPDERARAQKLAQRESELRTALDRTFAALETAATKRSAPLITHLEELHLSAARLSAKGAALNAALELLVARPDFARIAASLDSLLVALTNLTRSVALTTISHRPDNFAAAEVRLRRCTHLIRVLAGHLETFPPGEMEVAMTKETLRQIGLQLADTEDPLRATIDHGEAPGGFPLRLPELSTLSVRALTSWINPAPQLDPLLVRHTLRMAVLTMAGIAVYEAFAIPRGYWIAFTIIVVLQPDYGATRKRAAERILGTLAGSAVASAFLWVRLPLPVLDGLIAATIFGFAYYQKQRYGLAVFFVTLMLVLLTETATTVNLDFTVSRLLCNVAGGGLALAAALLFWPSWERQRFPVAMAAAVRASEAYLRAVASRLATGGTLGGEAVQAKRRAETAGSFAATSLQRMLGEPSSRQSNRDLAAALTHYNIRLTRAITALTLYLEAGSPVTSPAQELLAQKTAGVLSALGRAVEDGCVATKELRQLLADLPQPDIEPATSDRHRLVNIQLDKMGTEIAAMIQAMDAAVESRSRRTVAAEP